MIDSPRVLVIEDDPALRPLFLDLLSDEGYDVAVLAAPPDPEEFIEIAPALVLTDLLVGAQPLGWDFVRSLRGNPATTAVPVVVCTGSVWADDEPVKELERLGCKVVSKPFDIDGLLQVIASQLQADA